MFFAILTALDSFFGPIIFGLLLFLVVAALSGSKKA